MTAAFENRVIGIDGSRATVGRPTGTERFAIELLAAISDLEPADPFRVYFNSSRPPADVRFPGEAVLIPAPRFWTLRTLAMEMRRAAPDVLFVPSHVIPPVHPTSVVTIHDLGYLVEPDSHEPIHRKQLEWTTRWNSISATGVIAVSESTRDDLIERLDVPPEKIRVIPLGVSDTFRPASSSEVDRLRLEFELPGPFILAVGTIHPRKNLVRLIQAFELLASDNPEIALVIAGNPGWKSGEILERARRSPYAGRIRHLGYVAESEIPALYTAASVTAFVSLYEGFGLPALESMACGTPVVASNRSSLPEICSNGALLVDPTDTHQIASAIRHALEDVEVRERLICDGFERAAVFTWRRCALETLAFLRAIRDNSL